MYVELRITKVHGRVQRLSLLSIEVGYEGPVKLSSGRATGVHSVIVTEDVYLNPESPEKFNRRVEMLTRKDTRMNESTLTRRQARQKRLVTRTEARFTREVNRLIIEIDWMIARRENGKSHIRCT